MAHGGRIADTADVFRTVGQNPSLRRILLAFLFFNAQEYGVWIAVTLYAYERGGATTAGLVLVAQLVPSALVAPLASVLGDRVRRDRALTLGYAVQAVTTALLAVAMWTAPPLLAYAAAILASCSVTLTRPVHNAILPELSASPEQLTAANALSGTAEASGVMLGPALNSVLVAVAGPELVPAVFAAAMVLAAGLTGRLRRIDVGESTPSGGGGGLVAGAMDGARELRRDPAAAALTVLGGSQFVVLGTLDVLFVVLAVDVLRVGESGAGLMGAAVGVGGLLGAAATAALVGRRTLTVPLMLAVSVLGLGLAAVAVPGSLGPILVLLAIAGAGRSFFDVAARTMLQRTVRDDVLARVFGLQEALLMAALAIGAASASLLVEIFGPRGAVVVTATLMPVGAVVCLRPLRSLERRGVTPDPARLTLLRSLAIFEPLPQPVLERLSWNLIPLELAAGSVLIREGDPGDRIFIVVQGEVSVSSGGASLGRQGPGSYVGEIALLRDVPRTATVAATSDVRLLALERDEFLSAVTGSRRSALAAHAEADRRFANNNGS